MTTIENSIVENVFANDGKPLTMEYISGWLHLFLVSHTEEDLSAALWWLVENNILSFDEDTQQYKRVA